MRITITEAADSLRAGRVVAVPTETVYGLAAVFQEPKAVAEVFRLKKRPSDNPLIIHLAEKQELLPFLDEQVPFVEELTAAFWPGPLTLVLPIRPETIPHAVRAGLSTAAFRIPAHPLAQQLLSLTGPLVMPSANLSGRPSATQRRHVEEDFGLQFPVLDGGTCTRGLESTILAYVDQQWLMLRRGAISAEEFQPILKIIPAFSGAKSREGKPLCPGQVYRHYAPQAALLMHIPLPEDSAVAVIGFADRSYPTGRAFFSLGSSKNPQYAIEVLYSLLRALDDEGVSVAWVDMDFPVGGLWDSLRDRLLKASASH